MEDSSWKEFSNNIFKIFEPIIKTNTKDLVEKLEEVSTSLPLPKRQTKLSVNSSFLGSKYKIYNPVYFRILSNSRKYERLENRRKRPSMNVPLSVNPYTMKKRTRSIPREISLPPLKSPSLERKLFPLEVNGQRANIGVYRINLPNMPIQSHPVVDKIQSFLKEIIQKYEKLFLQLDKEGKNVISRDDIVEFVRNRESDYTYIREFSASPSDIMNVFDPFASGLISREFFFGILAIHEYSAHGMPVLPHTSVDITDLKHILALKSQVHKLKAVFCQYSEGKTMKREEFVKVIISISENPAQAADIVKMLEIGNSVSFGQFLLAVPYLLENYDNLSINH